MDYVGYVELHGRGTLSGWCVNRRNVHNAVTLDLYCGDVKIRSLRADNHRPDIEALYAAPRSGFFLPINDKLDDLLPLNTVIQVRDPAGISLPILSPEAIQPFGKAEDFSGLSEAINQGYRINKWGNLKRVFSSMEYQEKKKYSDGLSEMTEYFQNNFGITLFPHYGTLLGYARGKNFIPHDDDTDMSFCIRADYIEQVADHFLRIATFLKNRGHEVQVVAAGQMYVQLSGSQNYGCDIFASWIQSDGTFNTYFGVSGTVYDPFSTFEDRINGSKVKIPTHFRRILQCTYGPDWEKPDPDFQWKAAEEITNKMNALKEVGKSRVQLINSQIHN